MIAAAGAAVLAGSSVLCIRAAFRAGERARLIDRAHAGRSVGVREGAVPGSVMSVVRDRADTWAPALSCLLGLAVGVVLAGVPGAIVGAGGGLAFTVALRHRRTARNRSRLEEQLVDGVVALTAGLRAGMSVPQSLEYAADECDAPLGPSLRAVVDRASMGEPFGTALA
ncbi:MAG: type II secretion system F family protein, partial [Actinomycetota bacterium]